MIRLFAPAHPPGRRRCPVLEQLGAPIAGGAFTVDYTGDRRFAVRAALAEHRVGLVDPIGAGELLQIAWWALRLDRQVNAFVGPAIHFDADAYAAPELPPGVPIGEAVARYLAAAPVALAPLPGRLSVRQNRETPAPICRRSVPAPVWYGPHSPAFAEAARRARQMPGPARLLRWYQDVRATWWRRSALHCFLRDLAAGELVAVDRDLRPVPETYWRSDIELDLAGASLFLNRDHALPYLRGLAVYPAAAVPRPVAIRDLPLAEFGSRRQRLVAEAIAASRIELSPMTKPQRLAWLADRLPGVSAQSIGWVLNRFAA